MPIVVRRIVRADAENLDPTVGVQRLAHGRLDGAAERANLLHGPEWGRVYQMLQTEPLLAHTYLACGFAVAR